MIRIFCNEKLFAQLPWQGKLETVAAYLDACGAPASHPCGKHGRCGKCRVHVTGDVSAPSPAEQALLAPGELRDGVRLSCEARVTGGSVRVDLEGAAQSAIETSLISRGVAWEPWAKGLGLAVDIGTTTVAAYLWDLEARTLLDVQTCANPQQTFGADVVSRLEASMHGSREALRHALLQCLDGLARRLCRQAGRSVEELGGAVLTGNTSMLYTLHGLPVEDIAFAPFDARHRFGRFCTAEEIGLRWGDGCRVYIPPCIAAYVGADISCGLLACDVLSARDGLLLADIGTNGELALFTGARLLCCATAAGPAFEGVGITCGSSAVDGAVDTVSMREGQMRFHVLGGGEARTLCGSGLLDAVHCLRQLEIVDETGFLEADDDGVVSLCGEVYLTQKDVRALQLAKAAVCAGIETLLKNGADHGEAPHRVCLAGGFGCRLDPRSAAGIGLIPAAVAERKLEAVGNTAAAGASLLLRSEAMVREVERIAALAETVELAVDPFFQERFIADIALEASI